MNYFDKVLASIEAVAKSITGANKKGISHANSLISSGDVKDSDSWNPPSADEENSYIEKNGMGEYGKWFLGVDNNVDASNKGHFGYIYTSDFKNVDRKGIIAIKQRAAQQKQNDVFNAASKMLDKIDKKD